MDMKLFLVDDESLIRQEMRELLEQYEGISVVGEAENITETLEFLHSNAVDIIFSDIQMKGGSGFELAKQIHAQYPDILIVFLTGYAEFALDGYTYGPVDFLVKPVGRERLEQTLERIRERLYGTPKRRETIQIGVQTEDGYRIFHVEEIAYLEKQDRKVRIVKKNGESIKSGETMQELEEIFSEYGFFRCHQSYLVPLADVTVIRQELFGRAYKLKLRGSEMELPLSRRKYYEIREVLKERGVKFC